MLLGDHALDLDVDADVDIARRPLSVALSDCLVDALRDGPLDVFRIGRLSFIAGRVYVGTWADASGCALVSSAARRGLALLAGTARHRISPPAPKPI